MHRSVIGVITLWLVVSSHIIACVNASPRSRPRESWDYEVWTQSGGGVE